MQNEMRDRLVELIDDYIHYVDVKEWYSEELDEGLADYLIEEGNVIVPPCKVGDTVYYISERYTECTAYRERYSEYSCSGCDVYCDSIKERYIVEVEINNIHWIFNMWEEFGKTVFLTKEEAEKALKEGADNG